MRKYIPGKYGDEKFDIGDTEYWRNSRMFAGEMVHISRFMRRGPMLHSATIYDQTTDRRMDESHHIINSGDHGAYSQWLLGSNPETSGRMFSIYKV